MPGINFTPPWHDMLGLHEDLDLEYKSARGGLPRSLWETYSAMANTDGGVIILGVEDDGQVSGLADPPALRKVFWDTINNRGKVSSNLLTDADVAEESADSGRVLVIRVPRAGRNDRPVYVGQNPLKGTYRRNFEGDYHCSEQEVGRMLADRSEEPADAEIVEGFTLADLHEESLRQYRQRFSAHSPDHPWLSEDGQGLLAKLGGWRIDRRRSREGLTIAGLLMFGKGEAIRAVEALPGYNVDYRERLADDPQMRWTDRLTVDGTWEANLFQFYQRTIQRLHADLKLPFQLDNGQFRRGDTVVHEAIREALVNALIHADYRGEGGIVIEKYRDRLEVSNPGTLLVSREQLFRGGISECRNKALQTMFLLIGAAEKAGSGIDKILKGWQSQHWRRPSIQEQVRPLRVRLVMPTMSLMPEEALDALRVRFGDRFRRLSEVEAVAVVTAHLEGQVSNMRMREITEHHAADLTKVFQKLVEKDLLVQDGRKRGTIYRLAEDGRETVTRGGPLFEYRGSDSIHRDGDSIHRDGDSIHRDGDSIHSEADSIHNADNKASNPTDAFTEDESVPQEIAAPAQKSRRIAPGRTRQLILRMCSDRYLTSQVLGDLMNRNAVGLRQRFLKPMVSEGLLRLRYPDKPNRPDQAYIAAERAD